MLTMKSNQTVYSLLGNGLGTKDGSIQRIQSLKSRCLDLMQVVKCTIICFATNGRNLNEFEAEIYSFGVCHLNVSKITVNTLDNIKASHLFSKEHFRFAQVLRPNRTIS